MAPNKTTYEFFATCSKGVEKVLAQELTALAQGRHGARPPDNLKIRPLNSGVAFFGTLADAYRVLLHLSVASRVLLILARVDANDAEQLYAQVRALPWEEHIAATGTLAVDARGTSDELRDTRFVAQKVKDAICDRLIEQCGERPSVERDRPSVRVNVSLRTGRSKTGGKGAAAGASNVRATIALDLAGEPLHRRGYRVPSPVITAPLRETLAATMLHLAGWDNNVIPVPPNTTPASSNNVIPASLHTTPTPPNNVIPAPRAGIFADEVRNSTQGARTARDTSYLLDPLCGSGTIAIEAALIASGRAPGLLRDYWGFEGWLGHNAELWASLLDEADEQAEQGMAAALATAPLIFASDMDAAAVAVAQESARRAGVAELIHFTTADVAELRLSPRQLAAPGLLVTNPPYGERLASLSQLPALYAALGRLKASAPQGLGATIITPDDRIDAFIGSAPIHRTETFNGPLETAIRVWGCQGDVGCQGTRPPDNSSPVILGLSQNPPDGDSRRTHKTPRNGAAVPVSQPVAQLPSEFANRLRKMATHRGKWARRVGVSCYRVYDADLPDYAAAIDLYQGAEGTPDEGQRWLNIAEYAPPAHIDEQKAAQRLAQVLLEAPEVLGVPTANVFLKQRKRAKGGGQYASEGAGNSSTRHLIKEAGLLFEVEFSQHLDTGIFLDHRLTRALLKERAQGADCLNLFAYTGTASAYMAAGGARSVTTIDLSHTYLDWARHTMELNTRNNPHNPRNQRPAPRRDAQGNPQRISQHNSHAPQRSQPTDDRYRFEQADVLAWVQEHRHAAEKYGLIFVDPPTFSNSTRMGKRTWDVQRDHAELLIALSRMLTPGGVVVFSCNLRSFKPDIATLTKAKVTLEDITARTIPPDFERNPKIHHCYLATKA